MVPLVSGAETTIIINATLRDVVRGGTIVSNQASLAFDADNDGINESRAASTDPATTAPGPTRFIVASATPAPVPTLDWRLLSLLAILIAVACRSWTTLNQARRQ